MAHVFRNHQGMGELHEIGKEEMWNDVSPIWVRPQNGRIEMYSNGFLQVVGHTPVKKTDFFRNILTVDNFSTYCDGTPIGDQRFIWVDTVAKEWGYYLQTFFTEGCNFFW